ncbi:hypothetical protein [Bradyrhizobium sp. B120]|uniref:hypothetical protein n=1 Tax=Bradyrhizobium sp. B120 TaxID=3410088 RepID=UPI003B98444C
MSGWFPTAVDIDQLLIADIRDALETGASLIGQLSAVGVQRQAYELRFAKRTEMTDIILLCLRTAEQGSLDESPPPCVFPQVPSVMPGIWWRPEDYGFR